MTEDDVKKIVELFPSTDFSVTRNCPNCCQPRKLIDQRVRWNSNGRPEACLCPGAFCGAVMRRFEPDSPTI